MLLYIVPFNYRGGWGMEFPIKGTSGISEAGRGDCFFLGPQQLHRMDHPQDTGP